MAHFAKIDDNNIVVDVIIADPYYIGLGEFGDPSKFIQTSYNTSEGKHKLDGNPLRKNFAGKGYTYDAGRDAFIPPKPFASWTLDEETCVWKSPVERSPDDANSNWDEETQSWKPFVQPN